MAAPDLKQSRAGVDPVRDVFGNGPRLLRHNGELQDANFAGGKGDVGLDEVGSGGEGNGRGGNWLVVKVPLDAGHRLGRTLHQIQRETASR